jgi:hypothetical protein
LHAKSARRFSGRTFWHIKVNMKLSLESDEYCPHCDNKYVLDAVTKEDK